MKERPDLEPVVVESQQYGTVTRSLITPSDYRTPELAQQLGLIWASLVGELSPGSLRTIGVALRSFCTHLGAQPLDVADLATFSLGDLRLRHVNAWELALRERQRRERSDAPYDLAISLFALLRRIDADHPDLLHLDIKQRLTQPTRLQHIRNPGLPDHPDSEVRRIRSAAHRLVHAALQEAADRDDYLPSEDVIAALNILLLLATGEPPEVLRAITLDDITATPIETHQGSRQQRTHADVEDLAGHGAVELYAVTLTKRRAGTRYESIYDRSRDRSAHKALTAAIVLTRHARALAPTNHLWVVPHGDLARQMPWNSRPRQLSRWYTTHVSGDEPISEPHVFARLRKVTLRRELLANPSRYLRDGRRHTSRTLFQHYTNSEVLQQEAGKLLVKAITDHFEAAVGPTVVTPSAEDLLRGGATSETLDQPTAQALLAGELEGALAACRDPEDSPHAPAGDVCPSAFDGQCFTCPNAIITQEHLPALVLIDQLANPDRSPNMALWQQVWQPIHNATRQILPLFPADAVAAATTRIDDVLVDPGLRNGMRGVDA